MQLGNVESPSHARMGDDLLAEYVRQIPCDEVDVVVVVAEFGRFKAEDADLLRALEIVFQGVDHVVECYLFAVIAELSERSHRIGRRRQPYAEDTGKIIARSSGLSGKPPFDAVVEERGDERLRSVDGMGSGVSAVVKGKTGAQDR